MKLSDLTDIQLLAGTIRKEAEGEPVLGKMAVACVIRNRVADRRWLDSWQGVMLQAQQFSCFNGLDRGSDLSPAWVRVFTEHRAETWWRECQYVAFGTYWDWYGDVTGGANHSVGTIAAPHGGRAESLLCQSGRMCFSGCEI